MRCGTTPTHRFTIPPDINLNAISKARVTYSQNNKQVLCKEAPHCKIHDGVVKVELSQKETLLFNYKLRAEAQVDLLTDDNKSMKSDVVIISVEKSLNDEVLE